MCHVCVVYFTAHVSLFLNLSSLQGCGRNRKVSTWWSMSSASINSCVVSYPDPVCHCGPYWCVTMLYSAWRWLHMYVTTNKLQAQWCNLISASQRQEAKQSSWRICHCQVLTQQMRLFQIWLLTWQVTEVIAACCTVAQLPDLPMRMALLPLFLRSWVLVAYVLHWTLKTWQPYWAPSVTQTSLCCHHVVLSSCAVIGCPTFQMVHTS